MKAKIPNLTDKHVGQRVRMRRLMLGMSQEKLGDAIGLTFQQVQKYEKGTNRISSSRMQQIANVLQVAPPFFFEGVPGQSKTVDHAPMPNYCRNARHERWLGARQSIYAGQECDIEACHCPPC
jgi:transcriptional regulator with XRE-family HTH domain